MDLTTALHTGEHPSNESPQIRTTCTRWCDLNRVSYNPELVEIPEVVVDSFVIHPHGIDNAVGVDEKE